MEKCGALTIKQFFTCRHYTCRHGILCKNPTIKAVTGIEKIFLKLEKNPVVNEKQRKRGVHSDLF